MSETEVDEAGLRDALAELAKVSVGNLQRVFDRAPGGLGWEEIEQGLAEGRPLKEICGLPEDDLSAAYGEAKRLMGEGDLGGAKEILASLCLYDQQSTAYWGGLAKCCEGLGLFPEAAGCYRMLALITGGAEPLPYLGIGFCCLEMGDTEGALEALETGREICDPYDDEDRPVLEQMERLIERCGK